MHRHVTENLAQADVLLLGRKDRAPTCTRGRQRVKTRAILMCLALINAPQAFCGTHRASSRFSENTFTFTLIVDRIPGQGARIKNYRVGAASHAGQTGNLLVRYSDGATVLAWKAPEKSMSMPAEGSEDDERIGVDQIKVAKDGRTIGWEEMGALCCESYPLPISVGIYQSGERVLHIDGQGILDYWAFLDKGRRIVAVWGPAHGPQVLEYQIIDLKAKRVIASVIGDRKTQELDADAPGWALQAQTAMQRRE